MKKIQADYSFTNARNAEQMQLHTNMIEEALTETFAEAQGLGEIWAAYKAAVQAEQDCFLSNRKFEDTPILQAGDSKRDNGFYLVANVADAYAKFALDEAEKAAGERVAFLIQPARDAAHKGYAEETSILTDLYGKLQAPANATDVETLHLTEAVAAAKAANDAFNALYVERSKELRTRAESLTMKQLRPLTDAAFRDLAEAVNALYRINALVTKDAEKETALGNAIDLANGLLVQLDRVIRARGGNGSSTTEPTDPSDPTEPTDPAEPTDPTEPENPGGDEGGTPEEI